MSGRSDEILSKIDRTLNGDQMSSVTDRVFPRDQDAPAAGHWMHEPPESPRPFDSDQVFPDVDDESDYEPEGPSFESSLAARTARPPERGYGMGGYLRWSRG